MGVMFSSPAMITMFFFGILVIVSFVGAIVIAIYQTARGRLKVDYEQSMIMDKHNAKKSPHLKGNGDQRK